jgi:DNA-binding IclR family transcriptional regulator
MAATAGVAAVERALSLLDAFSDQDPQLSLAEIAKRTKLYKSTVLRLARSLETYGYLVRAEDGLYRLGSKVLHLGSLYQRHLHTADIVPDVLLSLVDDVKEGASFYVPDGDRRLCLHRVDSRRSGRDSVHEAMDSRSQAARAGRRCVLALRYATSASEHRAASRR